MEASAAGATILYEHYSEWPGTTTRVTGAMVRREYDVTPPFLIPVLAALPTVGALNNVVMVAPGVGLLTGPDKVN